MGDTSSMGTRLPTTAMTPVRAVSTSEPSDLGHGCGGDNPYGFLPVRRFGCALSTISVPR